MRPLELRVVRECRMPQGGARGGPEPLPLSRYRARGAQNGASGPLSRKRGNTYHDTVAAGLRGAVRCGPPISRRTGFRVARW